jgi:hypothetical protein
MKTIFNILDKRSFSLVWWLSLLLILIIAGADIASGNYNVSGPFFVLPILLASWYGSKRSGVSLAIFSAAVWIISRKVINPDNFNLNPVIYEGMLQMVAYSLLAIITTNFRSVYSVEVVS